MLGIRHEPQLVETLWNEAPLRAALPNNLVRMFFAAKGPMVSRFSSRRAYHRYFLRSKALLICDGVAYGGYTTDVSRQGVGFLSPVQLFPRAQCTLKLPNGNEFRIEVTRCRRQSKQCFLCGGRFLSGGKL